MMNSLNYAKYIKPLKSFQLITRYCLIESPYWKSFLEHYKSLGVKLFHICVQTNEDEEDFKNKFKSSCPNFKIHRINSKIPPNKALKEFNCKLLDPNLKHTLLVDSDEFIEIYQFDKWFKKLNDSFDLKIQWSMNMLENIFEDNSKGFFGHATKPACRTELIRKIRSDHRFDLIGFRRNFKNNHLDKSFYISLIAKYKMPNSVLIHYWSRSIEDVILRTIFSRFKSFKQSDQSEFFSKIKSGELPYRLKMMAYLNIQKEYLNFNYKFRSDYFDKNLENELLRSFGLTEILIDDIYKLYFEFKEKLLQNKKLPRYPSIFCTDMQKMKNYI